jgi:plastocyanin
MKDHEYYNLVAGGLAFGVVMLMVVWTAVAAASSGSSSAPEAPPAGAANMYLTIQINPENGMPQYSPANFTIPTGEVVFTIVDYDVAASWDGCTCNVTGTVGGTETVNGTSYAVVPSSDVSHSFDIPSLGLNVLSPGMSTVTFTLDVTQAGTYTWYCEMPCGADGYTGDPMGEPGFMTGTMTVA